jgi:peptide chain release factor 1
MQIPWNLVHDRIATLSLQLEKLQGAARVIAQKEHARLSKLVVLQKEIDETKSHIDVNDQIIKQLQLPASEQVDALLQKEYLSAREVQELVLLYRAEKEAFEDKLGHQLEELEESIIPADPHDEQSVFLEIRAGTGGQEAALFAADLANMYSGYALKKGWKVSVVDESRTDLHGVREITLHIQGEQIYGHLKFEAGVHRVQRVPKTETQGRVHTSTATVAVLPEIDEVDFVINPADLRIDVYRASGAGGQHVNTTDSAVRITHIPTGAVVACQDERSQHKNKAKALKILQSRIAAHEKEKQDAVLGQKRKEMIGRAMRSEKVRTYNFPQNRVTDHTIDLTLKKLDYIIEGDLDDLIEPLMQHEKEERKKEAFVFQ